MCIMFFIVFIVCFLTSAVWLLTSFDVKNVLSNFDSPTEVWIVNMVFLFAASFLVGYAIQTLTGRYRGKLWNFYITDPVIVKVFRFLGIIGGLLCVGLIVKNFSIIVGGFFQDILDFVIGFIKILFTGKIKEYLIWSLKFLAKVALAIIGFVWGLRYSTKVGLKLYVFSPSLAKLSEMQIFMDIDKYIKSTKKIFVDGTEISLYTINDERIRFIYKEYGLDDLQREVTAAETKKVASFSVGLIGLYFVKKYNDLFGYSIKKELVKGAPGSAGTRVTVVTPSGVYTGYAGGTDPIPDKLVFNGYMLERK